MNTEYRKQLEYNIDEITSEIASLKQKRDFLKSEVEDLKEGERREEKDQEEAKIERQIEIGGWRGNIDEEDEGWL